MLSGLQQVISATLPVTAMLSLTCGPSASAAYAESRARVAREERAKCSAKDSAKVDQSSSRSDQSSNDRSPKQDKPLGETAFVAPKAAKPANGEPLQFSSTPTAGAVYGFARLRLPGGSSPDQISCLKGLHHPAYQAHAPPADSPEVR